MTLREQLEERERQWRLFHEWEAENPPPGRSASAVLADLSFLLRFLTPEEIAADPDPEKTGIQEMRAAFARIEQK